MPAVEIYTTAYCPFCLDAKDLLKRKGVSFTEHAVDGNRELREAMIKRANGNRTVPQIFIDEAHIGGCDELYALEDAGELDKLLHLAKG